jgi:hypothetical protein
MGDLPIARLVALVVTDLERSSEIVSPPDFHDATTGRALLNARARPAIDFLGTGNYLTYTLNDFNIPTAGPGESTPLA